MIPYVVQKKRVVVMDCDITIQEEIWRKIMRHVLGRHFDNLRGKGPGWSFSHTHLDTFSSMVEKLQEGCPETSGLMEESFSEVGTQTSSEPAEEEFSSDVEKLQEGCPEPTSGSEEEECPEVGTQTSSSPEKETLLHMYRFDVDDQVRSYVDHWCKKFHIVLKN